MRRILKKAAAVVSSLLLAVSAAGSAGTLIGGASQAPVLTMSLLAGGDAVGIQFRLKQASTDNSTYSVYLDGEQQTLTDGKFLVVAESHSTATVQREGLSRGRRDTNEHHHNGP